jgi:protein-S-isoprenylcysteine O-methyltransferase Ste14
MMIVLFPSFFFRHQRLGSLEEIAEIFGIALILFGQLIRTSARGYKSEQSQNGHALIQGGPYLLVRNPMYLGILLIGLGIVLILFQWWVMAAFLIVFVVRYLLLIFKEEKKLLDVFSGQYKTYQGKVPRLIPPLTMLLQADISEYLPLKLSWLKKEIGTILAVLLITLFVESWQDISYQEIKLYLEEVIVISLIIIIFISLVIYLIRRTSKFSTDVTTKSKATL